MSLNECRQDRNLNELQDFATLLVLSFTLCPFHSVGLTEAGLPLTKSWGIIVLATWRTITDRLYGALSQRSADTASFTTRLMACSPLHLEDSWVTGAKHSSRFTKKKNELIKMKELFACKKITLWNTHTHKQPHNKVEVVIYDSKVQ